jgi:hypothetical protein
MTDKSRDKKLFTAKSDNALYYAAAGAIAVAGILHLTLVPIMQLSRCSNTGILFVVSMLDAISIENAF